MSELTLAANALLPGADTTMLRVSEAVVLGITTWTATDVVAWVQYRKALREVASGRDTSGIPASPPYPVGT